MDPITALLVASAIGLVFWKVVLMMRQASVYPTHTAGPRDFGRTLGGNSKALLHYWDADKSFDVAIVGESYYQDAIERVVRLPSYDPSEPVLVHLVPESGNPHDASAVRVEMIGATIGYLSRSDARSFRRRLSAANLTNQVTACDGRILGGGVDSNGRPRHYGVYLDLKAFAQ